MHGHPTLTRLQRFAFLALYDSGLPPRMYFDHTMWKRFVKISSRFELDFEIDLWCHGVRINSFFTASRIRVPDQLYPLIGLTAIWDEELLRHISTSFSYVRTPIAMRAWTAWTVRAQPLLWWVDVVVVSSVPRSTTFFHIYRRRVREGLTIPEFSRSVVWQFWFWYQVVFLNTQLDGVSSSCRGKRAVALRAGIWIEALYRTCAQP